jgi:hypothetical protein
MNYSEQRLRFYDEGDRSLAMGIATQPIGWRSFSELLSFPPSFLFNKSGAQIFYSYSARQRAAEAYVQNEDESFSRFNITIGRPYVRHQRRLNHFRFAALTPGGSYRCAYVSTCSAAPHSITLALSAPQLPKVSIRALMTPDLYGSFTFDLHSSIHGERSDKKTKDAIVSKVGNEVFEKGFKDFHPLFEVLARTISGKVGEGLDLTLSDDSGTTGGGAGDGEGPTGDGTTGGGDGDSGPGWLVETVCEITAVAAEVFAEAFAEKSGAGKGGSKVAAKLAGMLAKKLCESSFTPNQGDTTNPPPGFIPLFVVDNSTDVPSDGVGPVVGGSGGDSGGGDDATDDTPPTHDDPFGGKPGGSSAKLIDKV